MANYGSSSIVIELKDAGGTYRDISQFVRSINDISVEAMMEDSHGFGDTFAEMLASGFSKMSPITIAGIYDDAALTPYALWVLGASRLFKITWGGGHTTIVTVLMKKFSRSPQMEKLTTYSMELQPTGVPTEA